MDPRKRAAFFCFVGSRRALQLSPVADRNFLIYGMRS
jgi:hypothetical protein